MKLNAAKPGVAVTADDGFTCIRAGARLIIAADDEGALFVPCDSGRHYLAGQIDSDSLIGLEGDPD